MALLELFNLLHFIGIAFGLGGATIATIISAKAEKDKEIGAVIMKIMPSIAKIIWLGMVFLLISGVGLIFFVKWPLNKQILIIKHVLVAWIIIIGITMGTRMKKMSLLAPKPKEKPSIQFLNLKKQMKFLSILNLILWYLVTILSVFV